MTTPPSDALLRAGLTLHQRGTPLPHALQRGTRAVLARMASASRRQDSVWRRRYREALGARRWGGEGQVLDQAFEDLFERVGAGRWPSASPLSFLVATGLDAGLEPSPAVRWALGALDEQRAAVEIKRQWCRRGRELYRPDEVWPSLRPFLVPAPGTSPFQRLQGLARWVIDHVAYEDDFVKWGAPDYWQSPSTSLEEQTGDCEDMSLVLWSAARWLGLPHGRMAVGTFQGEGHAWVEFPEVGLWAEATSGQAGVLGHGPSPYRPILYIYPDRCEILGVAT